MAYAAGDVVTDLHQLSVAFDMLPLLLLTSTTDSDPILAEDRMAEKVSVVSQSYAALVGARSWSAKVRPIWNKVDLRC
jgi:hypothetical protein